LRGSHCVFHPPTCRTIELISLALFFHRRVDVGNVGWSKLAEFFHLLDSQTRGQTHGRRRRRNTPVSPVKILSHAEAGVKLVEVLVFLPIDIANPTRRSMLLRARVRQDPKTPRSGDGGFVRSQHERVSERPFPRVFS